MTFLKATANPAVFVDAEHVWTIVIDMLYFNIGLKIFNRHICKTNII